MVLPLGRGGVHVVDGHRAAPVGVEPGRGQPTAPQPMLDFPNQGSNFELSQKEEEKNEVNEKILS